MLRHFIPRNDNRVVAFTLAEVLITLTIIGVIAALTIPNLIVKHEEQQTIAKLKKTYSTLVSAQKLSIADSGEDYDKNIHPYNAFKKYLKIIKDCGKTGIGCFADSEEYKALDGKNISYELRGLLNNLDVKNKIVLEDGIAIAFVPIGYGYVVDNNDISVPYIIVDVNGKKPPNIFGKDTFMFVVMPNKIAPMGINFNEPNHTCVQDYCKKVSCSIKTSNSKNGIACTNWVITKGNMDYLKQDINAE